MTPTKEAEKLLDQIINESVNTPEEAKDFIKTDIGRAFFLSIFEVGYKVGEHNTLNLPQHEFMEQQIIASMNHGG